MGYSYPRGLNIYMAKEKVAEDIRNFSRRIGMEVNISVDDIEIVDVLGGAYSSFDTETNKLYLNDSVFEFSKANNFNLDNLLEKIKNFAHTIRHKGYHLIIWRKYGTIDRIDKTGLNELRGIHGAFSEGLAHLLTMYYALKNGSIGMVEPLVYKLEDLLKKESGDKAREMALDLIRNKREYLLVDERYRDAVIDALQLLIGSSLIIYYPTLDMKVLDEIALNREALAYCMAKVAIEMLKENYDRCGDLEEALYNTLSSYLKYRKRVIEEFPKCRDLFTFDENRIFIIKKKKK